MSDFHWREHCVNYMEFNGGTFILFDQKIILLLIWRKSGSLRIYVHHVGIIFSAFWDVRNNVAKVKMIENKYNDRVSQ
jgi:hypothetical protein